eukprot:5005511-Ditylum_brightwellii.AAC.1
MFACDRLLFTTPLAERLQSTQECKRLWLESVRIAVHDFKIIHHRTPSQRVLTDFFSTNDNTSIRQHPPPRLNNNDDTAYVPNFI